MCRTSDWRSTDFSLARTTLVGACVLLATERQIQSRPSFVGVQCSIGTQGLVPEWGQRHTQESQPLHDPRLTDDFPTRDECRLLFAEQTCVTTGSVVMNGVYGKRKDKPRASDKRCQANRSVNTLSRGRAAKDNTPARTVTVRSSRPIKPIALELRCYETLARLEKSIGCLKQGFLVNLFSGPPFPFRCFPVGDRQLREQLQRAHGQSAMAFVDATELPFHCRGRVFQLGPNVRLQVIEAIGQVGVVWRRFFAHLAFAPPYRDKTVHAATSIDASAHLLMCGIPVGVDLLTLRCPADFSHDIEATRHAPYDLIQPRAGLCADATLKPKVQLPALLALLQLQIALVRFALGRTRHVDQRCLDQRPDLEYAVFSDQRFIETLENLVGRLVTLRRMAISRGGRFTLRAVVFVVKSATSKKDGMSSKSSSIDRFPRSIRCRVKSMHSSVSTLNGERTRLSSGRCDDARATSFD